MRILFLFLLIGTVAACGPEASPDADSRRGPGGAPTAAYTRRMIFVGGREAAPAIVAFDHLALAGPTAVERRVGFWHTTGEGWNQLLGVDWSDDPIREPWRLIPHGPFRFLVGDAGEVEALIGRGEAEGFQLAPVGRIGEWSPDEPPQFRIHRGEWALGKDTIGGLLVDILPGIETGGGATALSELVLTDGAEFYLVARLPAAHPGELWLQRGERSETMAGVELARAAVTDSTASAAWRIGASHGEIVGELQPAGALLELRYDRGAGGEPPTTGTMAGTRAPAPSGGRATDGVSAPGSSMPDPASLQKVRGWIEIRGDRRPVFGVMRRAPA